MSFFASVGERERLSAVRCMVFIKMHLPILDAIAYAPNDYISNQHRPENLGTNNLIWKKPADNLDALRPHQHQPYAAQYLPNGGMI